MNSPARYLDSHLHLQAQSLELTLDSILERAEKAGVERMFCNATREEDWQAVINLADRGKDGGGGQVIVPFLGIHPWFAENAGTGWEERLLARLQECPAGIGEIGLDKCCRADFDRQQRVFEAQLRMASALRRPVAIHCVKAWGLLLEILEHLAAAKQLPTIMIHAYGGSTETLQRLIGLGCFISFSCRLIADHKHHSSFLATPLPRLLLETDSQGVPRLEDARIEAGGVTAAPTQARSVQPIETENHEISCNEPAYVPSLYAWAAAMRGVEEQELRQRIWSNGEIFTDTILPR